MTNCFWLLEVFGTLYIPVSHLLHQPIYEWSIFFYFTKNEFSPSVFCMVCSGYIASNMCPWGTCWSQWHCEDHRGDFIFFLGLGDYFVDLHLILSTWILFWLIDEFRLMSLAFFCFRSLQLKTSFNFLINWDYKLIFFMFKISLFFVVKRVNVVILLIAWTFTSNQASRIHCFEIIKSRYVLEFFVFLWQYLFFQNMLLMRDKTTNV